MKPTLEEIQDATLTVLGVRKEIFKKARKSRESQILRIKQIICLFGQRYGHSLSKIGAFLNLHHSTIHHGKLVAQDYYKYEKEYAEIVDEVGRLLKKIENSYESTIEHTVEGWVARNAFGGELNFFTKKPRFLDGVWMSDGECHRLPVDYFPQIEYDSKPQSCEMRFKLK